MKEAIDFLKNAPIFEELEDRDFARISACGVRKAFKKGDVILRAEESGSALFVIIQGEVKVVRIGEDGREVVLSILGSNDIFGELSLLDGETRAASVVAIDTAELFTIYRKDFLALLNEHPNIAVSLLKHLARRLRRADSMIKSRSLKDAYHRVGYALLQFADERGRLRDGKMEIDNLPVQQEIANMAGTTRETVSRTLSKMERLNLIAVSGNMVVLQDYESFRQKFI
ncbi:MAG: Crp/Fnr family transcriptional regulator [Bacteroidetes bacterium]|nr:Crp/Fnr family transcriptional regulator [Bacteroidota bacterium]